MNRQPLIGLAICVVLVIGCGKPGPDAVRNQPAEQPVANGTPAPEAQSETSSEKTPETPGADDVTLTLGTLEEVQQAIAAAKGRIVVCDFWSTSCQPCVREFPHLVSLSRKYPTDQVVCMSVSLDYEGLDPVDTLKEPVLKFLVEQKATLKNYLVTEENTTVYDSLQLASIPAVYVYDTDGSLKKRFDEGDGKGFTYHDHIIPLVDQLAGERFSAKSGE